jgi:hypothetical protein
LVEVVMAVAVMVVVTRLLRLVLVVEHLWRSVVARWWCSVVAVTRLLRLVLVVA